MGTTLSFTYLPYLAKTAIFLNRTLCTNLYCFDTILVTLSTDPPLLFAEFFDDLKLSIRTGTARTCQYTQPKSLQFISASSTLFPTGSYK